MSVRAERERSIESGPMVMDYEQWTSEGMSDWHSRVGSRLGSLIEFGGVTYI